MSSILVNHRRSQSTPHVGPGIAVRKPWRLGWSRILRVQAAIRAEAESAAMTSSEVLARVAEVASTDLLDFMHVSEAGIAQVDLRQTRRRGMGHLIKRLRVNRNGTQEIELEPRLPALLKLGEHYKLWKVEAEPQVTLVDIAKNLRDQYAQIGARRTAGRAVPGAVEIERSVSMSCSRGGLSAGPDSSLGADGMPSLAVRRRIPPRPLAQRISVCLAATGKGTGRESLYATGGPGDGRLSGLVAAGRGRTALGSKSFGTAKMAGLELPATVYTPATGSVTGRIVTPAQAHAADRPVELGKRPRP